MRLPSLVATSVILAGLTPLALGTPAQAAALPTTYSASAHADLIAADVSLVAASVAGLKVGHALSTVDSTADPASVAESANLDAAIGGFPIPVDAQTASAPPTDDPAQDTLVPVPAAPLINLGAVTRDTFADFGSAISCPSTDPTQVLSDAVTTLAATSVATLPDPLPTVAQVGASTVHSTTQLVENALNPGHWDVDSRVTTQLGDVSLLGGAAIVHVTSPVTTFAHSDGTTGTAGFVDPPTVSVDLSGTIINIPLNATPQSIPITIPGVNLISVNVTAFTPTDLSAGETGEADLQALVKIDVSLGLALPGDLAQVHLALAPQHVTATAPAGGVECLAIAAAPVITSPADGSTTQDQTPTITGTATYGNAGDPGTVTVKDGDGNTICTATVQDGGTWSCTPVTDLPLGTYTITAVETSSTATSPTSAPVTFTIADTTAPAPPVITTPADGSTTTDNTPAITGTAEPLSHVKVYDTDGTTVLCEADADAQGDWTCTPATPMSEGSHTITATATDGSNNTSAASAPNTFTIDSTTATPVITSPADGSSTNDNTPPITGTGEPGATITVTEGGTTLCTAVVDGNGDWTCTPGTPLGDGPHTIIANAEDPSGNTAASAPVTFIVDTIPPLTPTITSPADGSSTNDTTPAITGTGEPGSTITVTEGGTTLCTATVDAQNNWTCTPGTPLSEGPHTIIANAEDAAGNTSASAPSTFTVDTSTVTPVITAPTEGSTTTDATPLITGTSEANASVTVMEGATVLCTTTADGSGDWSCTSSTLSEGPHTITATAVDPATNSATSAPVSFTVDSTTATPVITAPTNGSTTNDPTPPITGTGEPGATVTVTEGGTTLCTAVVDGNGDWTCTPGTPLGDGDHTIVATAEDPSGNTAASAPVTFTVDTTAPAPPVITSPADGSTTGDTTPTITGTGEPGATVTVTEGATTLCTAVVNGQGNWSCTPTTPLGDGAHTITATQTDDAGNVSQPSAPVTFTVDSDLDDDGLTNIQEANIGTDPNDPDTDNDGLTDGQEVKGYQVAVCGAAATTFRTNPKVADTDADGLKDGQEATGSLNAKYGSRATNPRVADTDGEGLRDGMEVKGFNLKLTVTKLRGSSTTGMVKTNACKVDTDGDRLSDKAEKVGTKVRQLVKTPKRGSYYLTLLRSDPTKKDTDNDRLTDKQEVTGSANVKYRRAKSDPAHFDTDRGGVSDGQEVAAGSNPVDVLSTPSNPRAMGRQSTIG